MTYLTYNEYTTLGGKLVSESAFPRIERKAEAKLDFFTQNRLKELEEVPDEVKSLMVEFVDKLSVAVNGNITSYSNGIESFSFDKNQVDAMNDELCDMAIEYLPTKYISGTVEVYE